MDGRSAAAHAGPQERPSSALPRGSVGTRRLQTPEGVAIRHALWILDSIRPAERFTRPTEDDHGADHLRRHDRRDHRRRHHHRGHHGHRRAGLGGLRPTE